MFKKIQKHLYFGNYRKAKRQIDNHFGQVAVSICYYLSLILIVGCTTRGYVEIYQGGSIQKTFSGSPKYSGIYYSGTAHAIIINEVPTFLHVSTSADVRERPVAVTIGTRTTVTFLGQAVLTLRVEADSNATPGTYKLDILFSVPLRSGIPYFTEGESKTSEESFVINVLVIKLSNVSEQNTD